MKGDYLYVAESLVSLSYNEEILYIFYTNQGSFPCSKQPVPGTYSLPD